MPQSLVNDIGIAIVVSAALAFIARLTRQPLLLAYVAAGALLGPTIGLRLITDQDNINSIGSIGLLLLLFMVGLEINLKRLLQLGKVVIITTSVGLWVSIALSAAFFLLIGYRSHIELFYLTVAVSLTSTMIVVKLLYDKGELNTAAGRISLGVTVFQDLWTILFVALQPDLLHPQFSDVGLALVRGIALILGAFGVSRYVLPFLFHWIAAQPELLILAAVSWCFALAWLTGVVGLSQEMGALVAGLALSAFPYYQHLLDRLVSLRDLFLTLFFVSLGLGLPPLNFAVILLALLTAIFVVMNRFVTIFPFVYALGQGSRISWLASINNAHISEFSLVLVAMGSASGHLPRSVVAVLVLAMIISASLSTYLIGYSQPVFRWLEPFLSKLGLREGARSLAAEPAECRKEIVVLGFSRAASSFLEALETKRPEVLRSLLVIDFNPLVYRRLSQRAIACLYGDISRVSFLEQAGVGQAQLIISAAPDNSLVGCDNLTLVRQLRRLAPEADIVARAETAHGAQDMYQAGASFVLLPRLRAAKDLLEALEDSRAVGLSALREEQLRLLRNRREVK